jgi:MarR family transcriptional regulator, organic hydroperoxide resistance regulator
MSSKKKAGTAARPKREAAAVSNTVSKPELLVDGSDTEFRGLVHDLMAFAHHIEACRDGFGAIAGLTGVQYEIFMAVKRFQSLDGAVPGIGVGQVAARLHRSGAFITLEVNKLVAKGVLAKADDPADGRRVLLTVSKAGEALARRLAPVQQQVNDVLFACLDRKGFERLRALAAELVGCGDRATALIDYLASHPQAGADSRAA